VGRVATLVYFAYFLALLPLLGRIEKTLPLPASIGKPVLQS
jgi:ubiquinol-cytochrome c reductase cytochrome b subunit